MTIEFHGEWKMVRYAGMSCVKIHRTPEGEYVIVRGDTPVAVRSNAADAYAFANKVCDEILGLSEPDA